MKAIIFDASSIISLAMDGLIEELRQLRAIFKGHFIITEEVRREVVDKPMKRKRFELEALRVQQLIEDKVLESPEVLKISKSKISKQTNQIINTASKIFTDKKREIKLIHSGEASCLALSQILTEKSIQNVICVDERTMRMLVEKPENLKSYLEKKMHVRLTLKQDEFDFFKGFKIIRSAELLYVAYKKGLTRLKGKDALDALLWAVKFNGCAISEDEIEEIKRMR